MSETNNKPQQPPRELFLRDWEVNVKPLEDVVFFANKACVDYSLAGIKAAFLLNGGALLTVPALVLSFGLDRATARPVLLEAETAYALGLALAILLTFFSYATMYFESWAAGFARSVASQRVNMGYYPPQTPEEKAAADAEIAGADKKRALFLCIRNIMQALAVLFAFGSGGFFIAGSWVLFGLVRQQPA